MSMWTLAAARVVLQGLQDNLDKFHGLFSHSKIVQTEEAISLPYKHIASGIRVESKHRKQPIRDRSA